MPGGASRAANRPACAAQPGCIDLTEEPLLRNSNTPEAWLSAMPSASTAAVLVELRDLGRHQRRHQGAADRGDLEAARLKAARRREARSAPEPPSRAM